MCCEERKTSRRCEYRFLRHKHPWSLSRRLFRSSQVVVVVTGSADKTVKVWELEEGGESDDDGDGDGDGDEEAGGDEENGPSLAHVQTLKMTDDVVSIRMSNSSDSKSLLIFASSLDSTVKVYYRDTLKFHLSLYGHSLPALALDAAHDDTILASGGADKTIKIWGLDFGDCHRSLHGHKDAVTCLR